VAVTLALIGPRSTAAVSNRNAGAALALDLLWSQRAAPPFAAAPKTTTAAVTFQTLGPKIAGRGAVAAAVVIASFQCTRRACRNQW
jgi:hypothetical protein